MIKTLTAALALTALASLAVAAEPTKMSDTELDTVVAGVSCANNGWGNGTDDWDNGVGYLNGGTADSKTANGSVDGGINLNPTDSTGR